jgi:Asp-tRNA(Asn)/Glu-tRNA(Gln) amidotransferase A subunit family amidase
MSRGLRASRLPVGIPFSGRASSEAKVTAMACAYSQATDRHGGRPPVPLLTIPFIE